MEDWIKEYVEMGDSDVLFKVVNGIEDLLVWIVATLQCCVVANHLEWWHCLEGGKSRHVGV